MIRLRVGNNQRLSNRFFTTERVILASADQHQTMGAFGGRLVTHHSHEGVCGRGESNGGGDCDEPPHGWRESGKTPFPPRRLKFEIVATGARLSQRDFVENTFQTHAVFFKFRLRVKL